MSVNVNTSTNTITVQQDGTRVIQVSTPGPQGQPGPQGDSIFTNINGDIWSTTSSLLISNSLNISGNIYFNSGSSITTTGPSIDMTAGPDGRSKLGSNNGQNYVWVDNAGLYLVTSWDSNVLTSAWRIETGSRTLTAAGNLNMNGYIITGSLNAPSITGSLQGTSSWAIKASEAMTASYVTIAQTASYVQTAQTASYILQAISSSFSSTASFIQNAQTASYIVTAQTASYVTIAQTSSYISQAVSSSFALTSSVALSVSTSISTQNLQHNVLFVDTSGPGSIQVDGGLRYNPNQDLLTTTSSYTNQALSSSFALTASYLNILNQNITVTGSINTTGSSFNWNNNQVLTTPSATTGTVVSFTSNQVYNEWDVPGTGNITDNLTGAKTGIVQKIYHNNSVAPSTPAGWVVVSNGVYVPNTLNIIYAEWVKGTRVEYWITQ
jgi:hypothetical protein